MHDHNNTNNNMRIYWKSLAWLMMILILLQHDNTATAFTASSSTSRHHGQRPKKPSSPRLHHAAGGVILSQQSSGEEEEEELYSDFDGWIGDTDVVMEYSASQEKAQSKQTETDDDDDDMPSFDLPEESTTTSTSTDENNNNLDAPDSSSLELTQLFQETRQQQAILDRTGIRSRQFSLGADLVLSDYVGNLGFDEVTDWEYYYPGDDDDNDSTTANKRQVVQPNPFDKAQPKRTRVSSGSVVRIFRGEFVGLLGSMLSSQGLDKRVLVKEFTGKLALELASSELTALATLQSTFVADDNDKDTTTTTQSTTTTNPNDWAAIAAARSGNLRKDHANVVELVRQLQPSPFLGILGEVNLAELEGNMDPNDFYRAMGVPPPKPEAVWLVYEYAGLSTIQAYAQPALIRRNNLPPKKGFFGNIVTPDPLPPWKTRAQYVVQGIVRGAMEGLALIHEQGLVHRSLGRTSVILSSKSQDKREAVSVYATLTSNLIVKLADFGFAVPQSRITTEDFVTRARSFGLTIRPGQETNVQIANFAMAEDMHALGFVILALLLNSLAELVTVEDPMPPTDEDSLQRLLGEIFDKDVKGQFREYVENEEIWSNLVVLLDEDDGAGWNVLDSLMNAREKAAAATTQENLISVRGLLNNPFFQK